MSFRSNYITNKPRVYTAAAASIFVFTAIVFLLYDWLVKRRHKVLTHLAVRSNAIVASMFPSMVRDRLFQNAAIEQSHSHASNNTLAGMSRTNRRLSLFAVGSETPKIQLKTFMHDSAANTSGTDMRPLNDALPIADYFPTATVLFADIVGFTAWCSQREPTQVFILLETIYGAFDALAKRHGVFKIETVGDCYMAVTGLPDPQDDHAEIMAKFASACLKKMRELTKKLEASLGPGTAELSARIGLHSGPVTAGVLRGEKSRFQLFGDTVNTASRMESNGQPNRIHVSEETAHLLDSAGKGHWIRRREGVIFAKGKGELQTYWLLDGALTPANKLRSSSFDTTEEYSGLHDDSNNVGSEGTESTSTANGIVLITSMDKGTVAVGEDGPTHHMGPSKISRLVDWNTRMLLERLKAIVASRQGSGRKHQYQFDDVGSRYSNLSHRDQVVEIIPLPAFDPSIIRRAKDPETVEIHPQVVFQLRQYVASIATMYKNNAFHNFEHASHVTMSSNKLLQRVTSPDDVDYQHEHVKEQNRLRAVAFQLHERTFGITSDPLAQFAVVFSALVHDVDHTGLTNMQIIQQNDPMAVQYNNKSVAEQNSITKARDLMMNDDFTDLRRCIYATESEAQRFWQVVVNSVMATDLFDAELREFQKRRWEKAFSDQSNNKRPPDDASEVLTKNDVDMHLKATTVIEHIIQASDVVHTMQHWHIYQKWNKRLFTELYTSFQRGLMTSDPSLKWYQGELDFFDNYIIPLAKKLKGCGVFGVSGDEFLNYAQENRKEWSLKGETIVKEMVASYHHQCSAEKHVGE